MAINTRNSMSILVGLLLLLGVVLASPVGLPNVSLEKRAGSTFIGYNGFSGNPRPPQASAGGELGAVFYIADAVDLAKLFAKGPNPSKDTICMIYADATEWSRQPKVWVPERILQQGGNAVNKAYVGSIVFAPHTNAGLPAGAPAHVYQLGIRQAQIPRLKLTTDCHPKSYFANDHHTLNYPSLDNAWDIQRPKSAIPQNQSWLSSLFRIFSVFPGV